MAELSSEDIFREKKTRDPNSITSLTFTHKALSNVSCLSDFKNLERLDLTFNNLSSLKGLESCANLKWLCVQQNKLQSLKGIEGLANLTVFNAGKNKLRSMDEVKNLVKLRALILNDNEIALISGLDQLKELNTLVLSRNPIRNMGNALAKLKAIAKISLSNCQLEDINSSIKACIGLEQLRLAHNDIKTLPAELAYNKKLQILDLGNNMISRWSDLEVLSSLRNLKNLNLLGNPIAEKAKLVKKIKKLVPSLQILNSKRMDKLNRIEKDQKVEDALVGVGDELEPVKKTKKDHDEKYVDRDANPNNSLDVGSNKHVKQKGLDKDHNLAKDKRVDDDTLNMVKVKPGRKSKFEEHNTKLTNEKEYQLGEERGHMKKKHSKKTPASQVAEGDPDVTENDVESETKKHKRKKEKHVEKELMVQEAAQTVPDKRSKRKAEKAGLDVIDDKETPFAELLAYDVTENMKSSDGERRDSQAVRNLDSVSALVTFPKKKKETKNQGAGASALKFLKSPPEVGLGGPSAWTDDDE